MSYPNRPINQYRCEACGGVITTIDLQAGTTPFMVRCRASKGCAAMMTSAFYQVDQSLPPAWEWRAPTKTEYYQLDRATREDHVDRGGLLLYPIHAARPPAQRERPKEEIAPKRNTRGSARRRRNRQRTWTKALTEA